MAKNKQIPLQSSKIALLLTLGLIGSTLMFNKPLHAIYNNRSKQLVYYVQVLSSKSTKC